jgi:TonB family protein
MMTPDAHISGPVRVSILERLVPSFAFAVAALSGAIGGLMLIRFLNALRQSENAGYASFFGGTAEIEVVVGGVLVFASVLCAIGIIVSLIRLFTTNTKASPPGILFLIMGLLSLVPPFAIHYVLHLMKGILIAPDIVDGGISAVADTVIYVSYFAIGSAGVIALVLLAFSFIPFSSRAGRKASPLVCLILVEITIAVLIGVYFWEARTTITERDKERTFYPEDVPSSSESSLETPDSIDGNRTLDDIATDDTFGDDTDTTSNARSKTISGGVLNDKAISLPQPAYPPVARSVRATGSVSVQVLVDEKGEVVLATAVSGHPLLRSAAVQAARQARFAPTKLSGQPVNVNGVLTYNFSGL